MFGKTKASPKIKQIVNNDLHTDFFLLILENSLLFFIYILLLTNLFSINASAYLLYLRLKVYRNSITKHTIPVFYTTIISHISEILSTILYLSDIKINRFFHIFTYTFIICILADSFSVHFIPVIEFSIKSLCFD